MTIEHVTTLEPPFDKTRLTTFLEAIPDDAEITLVTKIVHGGSQRDPEEHVEVIGLRGAWRT